VPQGMERRAPAHLLSSEECLKCQDCIVSDLFIPVLCSLLSHGYCKQHFVSFGVPWTIFAVQFSNYNIKNENIKLNDS
jgi:hypothetical protein